MPNNQPRDKVGWKANISNLTTNTSETVVANHKINTAAQAKQYAKKLSNDIKNYQKYVSKMSKADFSYHLKMYEHQMRLPVFWIVKIFDKHFDEDVKSFSSVLELADEAQKPTTDFNQPSIPFLMYMNDFWAAELKELQETWVVDKLDFAIMACQHQIELEYRQGWSYYTVRDFLEGLSLDEVTDLLAEAMSIIDAGDSIKLNQEFYWLVTIKNSMIHNQGKIKDHTHIKLNRNIYIMHDAYLKSADAKLKKAAKIMAQKGATEKSVSIELTADEIEVLTSKTEKSSLEKQRRKFV